MPITIENPTADAIWQAVQHLPHPELARLRQLMDNAPSLKKIPIDESTEWSDEDLRDFSNAGFALYEEIEAEELKAQAR